MKYLVIIIPSIMLLLVVGGTYYLSKRFAMFFPAFSFRNYLWFFGSTIVLLLFGIQFFAVSPNPIGKIIFILGAVWASMILYLLVSMAIIDLVNLFIETPPIIRGISSLVLAAIFVIYGIINASTVKVKEISVPIAGLTKEVRAVHVTDVHLGNFWGKTHLEQIVDKANELNPDVVFNTGDMFDSQAHFNENSDVLKPFDKFKVPHYFVYGNHDQHVGVEEVIKRMKTAGAIVLRNEIVWFGELQIIGLDNMLEDENEVDPHTKLGTETIKSVMSKLTIEENKPAIVLQHRPAGFEYIEAKKTNLLLVGHTHGGQLFPITLIAKLVYGQYIKGLHKYNDMSIYVSQGAGTILPVRVGTDSEITLIRLVPEI